MPPRDDKHLVESIVLLQQIIDGLNLTLHKNTVELSNLNVVLDGQDKKLNKLYTIVIEGNGESVVTRLSLIEQKCKNILKNIDDVDKQTTDKISNILAKTKETRSNRLSIKLGLINSLTGAVAAGMVLILQYLFLN